MLHNVYPLQYTCVPVQKRPYSCSCTHPFSVGCVELLAAIAPFLHVRPVLFSGQRGLSRSCGTVREILRSLGIWFFCLLIAAALDVCVPAERPSFKQPLPHRYARDKPA